MTRIAPAPRVDWNRVLLGLRAEGYTFDSLSTLTGIPRSTMATWQNGCSPRHQDGETLIAFWCETMQLPRESLPTAVDSLVGSRVYGNRD